MGEGPAIGCWLIWAKLHGLLMGWLVGLVGPDFVARCWALIMGLKIDQMGLNLGLGLGHIEKYLLGLGY